MIVQAVGVLFLAKNTGRCLFQLRNSDKRHKNTWGFFGGMLEPGEKPYDALCRECREEIGFVPEMEKLNPIDVYQSNDKNFMYYSFVAVIDHEFVPELNHESNGYAWVSIGNWPKPLHMGASRTLNRNRGKDKLHSIWSLSV